MTSDLQARLEQALILLQRSQAVLAEVDDDDLPAGGEVLEADLRGYLANPPDPAALLREVLALRELRSVLEGLRHHAAIPGFDWRKVDMAEQVRAMRLVELCAAADKERTP